MAVLKPGEIDPFLRKPSERVGVVLIWGSDDGLVTERASALVATASGGGDDPFSLVRLDGGELVADPARLVDEARTVSLFGNRRVVWVRDCGARNLLPAVQPLLDEPSPGSLVVLEAGDLKKTSPLRKKIEDHPTALALACWADDARDLARLVDRELADARLSIDRDAREALEAHLGGDRMASRGEIRKLCLYAHGRDRIVLADVAAIVGDASALAFDEFVDAVAGGEPSVVDRLLGRLEASGTPPAVAGAMLQRHFQLLERLRADMSGGRKPVDVVAAAQPPIFFRRRAEVARQVGLWTPDRLRRAAAIIDDALLRTRRMPALASAVLSDAALTLSRAARAAERR
ncbi:MAG: DNA polymerase III subunit delta [Hyphomicrobiales bacterium]|nr:DNA polymerase III subunit delta [Hyphomicrobiales bacterium]